MRRVPRELWWESIVMPVYVLATLDTKGQEAQFVVDELAACGVETRLMDVGTAARRRRGR